MDKKLKRKQNKTKQKLKSARRTSPVLINPNTPCIKNILFESALTHRDIEQDLMMSHWHSNGCAITVIQSPPVACIFRTHKYSCKAMCSVSKIKGKVQTFLYSFHSFFSSLTQIMVNHCTHLHFVCNTSRTSNPMAGNKEGIPRIFLRHRSA